ncbi:MAG TPA: tetratricopeptide repeat-containing protein, partial [Pyrinomonadaceae bacterium]
MRAFIVRPFGIKNEIDFDAVDRDLIAPALHEAGFTGGTTIDILRAGNIRIDMFQRLLTADLVVADLSIHNANVFYELGIRHSLRDKRTFLLRSDTDKFPFDLQTDRYFTYDRANPAASLPLLVAALRQTKNSEEQDSPVFRSLPSLEAQDRSHFLAVPLDFREEVERAAAAREVGDLDLIGVEAQGFEWESEGLRLVGRAQFDLKAFEGGRATWEAVRQLDQFDREANTLLGTIYQRLGDLVRSDQALKRVLGRKGLDRNDRAEVHSLLGRNAKIRWTNDWKQAASLPERQRLALQSPYLDESLEAYEGAFDEDLNHFYSGLNALAMLT